MKRSSVFLAVISVAFGFARPFIVSPPIAEAETPTAAPHIAPGSKLFIEQMGGFETYLTAAMLKKEVPIVIVDDRAKADFIVSGTSNIEGGDGHARSQAGASISVKDERSGDIVFAYSVDKTNAVHGSQSTAEACAKHLKDFIEKSAPGSKAWPQR